MKHTIVVLSARTETDKENEKRLYIQLYCTIGTAESVCYTVSGI